MAKFDYSKSRQTAKNLINKFGLPGQFIKTGENGGFDEWGNPAGPSNDVVIDGIVTPLLPLSQDEIERIGENITEGDKMCFFHSEVAPDIGYLHTQNGIEWRVVAVLKEITSVDGVNVFRKLQMRR